MLGMRRLNRKGLANQDERRPVIRVGISLPKISHRALQGQCFVRSGPKVLIEPLHKLCRALIVDVPEGDQDREGAGVERSEEHTSELQSRLHLVCRLLLEKKKKA